MKKTLITLALTLSLSLSALLTSCGGNTATGGTAGDNGSSSGTTAQTETDKNVIDEAESMMGDAGENATHGVEDGTPGGHSARGGDRHLIPRGK